MSRNLAIIIAAVVLAGTIVSGSLLSSAQAETVSDNLAVRGNLQVSGQSNLIGGVRVSGVTFFNGTLINSSVGSDGSPRPVTVGDDIRIDGSIFRIEKGGANALRVADNILPETSNAYSLGDSSKRFHDGYFSGKLTVGEIEVDKLVAQELTLSNGALSPSKIAGTALVKTTTFGGDVSGIYNNLQIGSGKVGSTEIADGSIKDVDINANAAITASKIADGSGSGLDADKLDGLEASNLARISRYFIPGGGGSLAIAIPRYCAFQINLGEAFGSPNHVAWLSGIENDGDLAWVAISSTTGEVSTGTCDLDDSTQILSLGANITLSCPGNGNPELSLVSSLGEDVHAFITW